MANVVPQHNINFEVYDLSRGAAKLLGLATIDFPELQAKTVEVSGAGVLGTHESVVKSHFDAVETTLHFRVLNGESLRQMKQTDAVSLKAYVAQQYYDAGGGTLKVPSLQVTLRGFAKSINMGKAEPSELGEVELVLSVDYIKVVHDGKTWLEYDVYNYIYNVEGVDYMAEIRKAVGL